MQGERTTVDSFTRKIHIDQGSSSSSTGQAEQHFANMQNFKDNRLPDYLASSNDGNTIHSSVINHESRNLDGWTLSSSLSNTETASQLDERRDAAINSISLGNIDINLSSNQAANGPVSLQNFRHGNTPRDLNLNYPYTHESGGDEVIGSGVFPHQYDPHGSGIEHLPSANHSNDPSEDGRPGCSSDGRRQSCKRKSTEASVSEQLSLDRNNVQRDRNSAPLTLAPSSNSSNMSLQTSVSVYNQEQPNTQVGSSMRGALFESHSTPSFTGATESSQRNSRLRVNPLNQQHPATPSFSTGNIWFSSSSSAQPYSPSVSSVRDLNVPVPFERESISSMASNVLHPGFHAHMQPFPWLGAPSNIGTSENPFIIEHSGSFTSRMQRLTNISTAPLSFPPLFPVPEMNLVHDPPNPNSENTTQSISRDPNSTFRLGSSPGYESFSPTWFPHNNSAMLYPRRLSEIRRPWQLSTMSELHSQGSSSNSMLARSGPFVPLQQTSQQGIHRPIPRPVSGSDRQEVEVSRRLSEVRRPWQLSTMSELHSQGSSSNSMLASSGPSVPPQQTSHQGIHRPIPRPASRSDSQEVEVSAGVQALSSNAEERNRLLSEIRSVLGSLRRGDHVNLSNFASNLHRTFVLGLNEVNDLHSDMRLEIDDMSYEELLDLEESMGTVSTGLDEDTIDKYLKQQIFQSNQKECDSDCCICQEEMVGGENAGILDCGHDFHAGCISRWLTVKNECPICKTKALTVEEGEEE